MPSALIPRSCQWINRHVAHSSAFLWPDGQYATSFLSCEDVVKMTKWCPNSLINSSAVPRVQAVFQFGYRFVFTWIFKKVYDQKLLHPNVTV